MVITVKFFRFLLSRLAVYISVIFIGVTIVFFVPRALPSDPVEAMLARLLAQSDYMEPEAVAAIRETLTETFGLEGSLASQYFGFFKRVLLTHDFGPSLSQYPIPVMELIGRALPWTMGLMMATIVLSWVIGNAIGLLAGFRKEKWYSKALESLSIVFYPIPYYIVALFLIIAFAHLIPIFPLATSVRGRGFSFEHIRSILFNSFLPGLSMVVVGTGWWVISMKTLAGSMSEEDSVNFARLKGLSEHKIMTGYVMPASLLPQITSLALRIGGLFGGALVTEILFSYPGLGMLVYSGIAQNDYNLIMGAISISIVAVATATFVVDLLYPFVDPRIRYT
jgi:peptide/nickel transport system permease protein